MIRKHSHSAVQVKARENKAQKAKRALVTLAVMTLSLVVIYNLI